MQIRLLLRGDIWAFQKGRQAIAVKKEVECGEVCADMTNQREQRIGYFIVTLYIAHTDSIIIEINLV